MKRLTGQFCCQYSLIWKNYSYRKAKLQELYFDVVLINCLSTLSWNHLLKLGLSPLKISLFANLPNLTRADMSLTSSLSLIYLF